MADRYLKTSAGTPMNTPDSYLCLLRASHVFSETMRVYAFEKVCQQGQRGDMDAETTRQVHAAMPPGLACGMFSFAQRSALDGLCVCVWGGVDAGPVDG